MSGESDVSVVRYGWTAVPRSLDKLVASRVNPQPSRPIPIEQIDVPKSELAIAVTEYARQHLSGPTFSHSMRAFCYGQAILQQHFSDWVFDSETYLLACLLHDIGTTDANIASTQMSFEFKGGLLALELLGKLGAPQSQAEAVAETIIRHQDVGDTGNVPTVTAVILFATLFDNVGGYPELVHEETIKNVVAKYPREKWTGCFAGVVRKETSLKPWSSTTKIEGFAEKVEANKLMQPYD